MIRLLQPTTLEQALKLARFYEHSQTTPTKKGNTYRTGNNQQSYYKSHTEAASITSNNKSLLIALTKGGEVVYSKPRPLTYSKQKIYTSPINQNIPIKSSSINNQQKKS